MNVGDAGPLGPGDLARLEALTRQGAGHVWPAAEVAWLAGHEDRLTRAAVAAARSGQPYMDLVEGRCRVRALLAEIRAGTPILTAGEAEPVAWAVNHPPSVLELARLAHTIGGNPGPDWEAERDRLKAAFLAAQSVPPAVLAEPGRAQLGGLINAVSSLQENLASAGIMDPEPEAGERLIDPAAFLAQFDDPSLRAPIYGRRRIEPVRVAPKVSRRRVCPQHRPDRDAVTFWAGTAAGVCALIPLLMLAPWAALAAMVAAALWLTIRPPRYARVARPPRTTGALARPPGRGPAGMYPPSTRAERYAAARARYIATGKPADLAEMERHVAITPEDDGPEWTAG